MIDQNILNECERTDEDKRTVAEKVAENMTGQPKPVFDSPEERHRVVMENAIVTLIRIAQAIKLNVEEINAKMGGTQDVE